MAAMDRNPSRDTSTLVTGGGALGGNTFMGLERGVVPPLPQEGGQWKRGGVGWGWADPSPSLLHRESEGVGQGFGAQ